MIAEPPAASDSILSRFHELEEKLQHNRPKDDLSLVRRAYKEVRQVPPLATGILP